MLKKVTATAIVLLLATTVVVAQTPTVVVEEKTILETVLDSIIPLVLTALSGVVLLIINSVAGYIKAKFGIDIEARHREALHSAIMTGLKMAMVRLGWVPGTPIPETALMMAVDYASRTGAPEAVKALDADRPALIKIAESKVPEAAAEITASGPDAVTVK